MKWREEKEIVELRKEPTRRDDNLWMGKESREIRYKNIPTNAKSIGIMTVRQWPEYSDKVAGVKAPCSEQFFYDSGTIR